MNTHDTQAAAERVIEHAADPNKAPMTATEAAVELFQQYARERPEVVALWAFGIGFVLGWKLKPW